MSLTLDPEANLRFNLLSSTLTVNPYPAVAMEIVVDDPEAFPGVVAPVSPAHQVLYHQANVN
jgi:hypothetical protein